jgi:hypothetical protein
MENKTQLEKLIEYKSTPEMFIISSNDEENIKLKIEEIIDAIFLKLNQDSEFTFLEFNSYLINQCHSVLTKNVYLKCGKDKVLIDIFKPTNEEVLKLTKKTFGKLIKDNRFTKEFNKNELKK